MDHNYLKKYVGLDTKIWCIKDLFSYTPIVAIYDVSSVQSEGLAQEASLVLAIEAPEDNDVYVPMQSRMIQLTLIDVLATGVILRRGEDFHGHLKTIKQSLTGTRLAAFQDSE